MLFLFLRYLHFCPVFFGHAGKPLAKKPKLYLKIYGVMNWKTITIHTLRNISRSKGNQVIKFCQLLDHYVRNNFLKKIMQNMK